MMEYEISPPAAGGDVEDVSTLYIAIAAAAGTLFFLIAVFMVSWVMRKRRRAESAGQGPGAGSRAKVAEEKVAPVEAVAPGGGQGPGARGQGPGEAVAPGAVALELEPGARGQGPAPAAQLAVPEGAAAKAPWARGQGPAGSPKVRLELIQCSELTQCCRSLRRALRTFGCSLRRALHTFGRALRRALRTFSRALKESSLGDQTWALTQGCSCSVSPRADLPSLRALVYACSHVCMYMCTCPLCSLTRLLFEPLRSWCEVLVHCAAFVQVYTTLTEMINLDLPYTCMYVVGACPEAATQVVKQGWDMMTGRYSTLLASGSRAYVDAVLTELASNGLAVIIFLPAGLMLLGNVCLYVCAARATMHMPTANSGDDASSGGHPERCCEAQISDVATCYEVQRLLRRRCASMIRLLYVLALLGCVGYGASVPFQELSQSEHDDLGVPAAGFLMMLPYKAITALLGGCFVRAVVPTILLLQSIGWWRPISTPIPSAADLLTRTQRISTALAAAGQLPLPQLVPFLGRATPGTGYRVQGGSILRSAKATVSTEEENPAPIPNPNPNLN